MIQHLFSRLIPERTTRKFNTLPAAAVSRPLSRRLILHSLRNWREGQLEILFPDGDRARFGEAQDGERATLHVRNHQLTTRLLLGGEIAVGDAYVDGLWEASDLVTLLRLFIRNRSELRFNSAFARISQSVHHLLERMRPNTREGAERNVHAHYDLGNDLYRLFLDSEHMAYSCAVYANESDTLESAQARKIELVCQKLQLRPADHLIEIGSGWGGLAIHAAKTRGCRVTTATASREQWNLARERVAQAGVSDRIEVVYRDYRDLEGQYDKLVSIEMFEQVGHRFFADYFKTCSRLLKPDGIAVIQTIGMPDQDFDAYRRTTDWMQRRIFPGTFLPSPMAMLRAIGQHTDLVVREITDIGPHYAPTLRAWRERFLRARTQVLELGYSESFIRAWELYLAFSEASFAERTLQDFQLTLNHRGGKTAC